MTPNPDWLDVAARRSAEHSWMLGATLDEYCKLEQISRREVAAFLDCGLDVLAWLSLCRRPSRDAFIDDLLKICGRFELEPCKVAQIIRRVDVLQALQLPAISRRGEERMLLAARDREHEKSEEQ